eukprot:1006918-Amphidinium_carterae.1
MMVDEDIQLACGSASDGFQNQAQTEFPHVDMGGSLAKFRRKQGSEVNQSYLQDVAKTSPCLAGAPLPVPVLHATAWKPGEVFTQEDDPDRINTPWDPPEFIRRKDPKLQRTAATEIDIPRKPASSSFARVVRGVLDEEDCVELIEK